MEGSSFLDAADSEEESEKIVVIGHCNPAGVFPGPNPIDELKEEIKELKEENADLKMRIAKCEALLFTTCAEGHWFPKSNPWCPECDKRLREEPKVGFEKQLIDGVFKH